MWWSSCDAVAPVVYMLSAPGQGRWFLSKLATHSLITHSKSSKHSSVWSMVVARLEREHYQVLYLYGLKWLLCCANSGHKSTSLVKENVLTVSAPGRQCL